MHRPLGLLVLLTAACAVLQVPPLRTPAWSAGASVFVRFEGESNQWYVRVRSATEDQFRAAGFRVLGTPEGKGELEVALTFNTPSKIGVAVTRSGVQLDGFQTETDMLSCNNWATIDERCVGRLLVTRVVDSKPVEQSLVQTPPAAAPAAQAAGPAPALKLVGKLAVLELRSHAAELTAQNAQYFTDLVRSVVLRTQPQLKVMTRENLLVLLKASGKPLEECEGECEVDTGRRIGADYIVSGELQKVGTALKLSLRMHATQDGNLVASVIASGKSIDELDAAAQKAATELLGGR